MSHEQFLEAFAQVQKLGSVEALLAEHADRYAFQINSRNRGRDFIRQMESRIERPIEGMRVLDIGCAYGAFAIELANRGARVTGVDVSDKWLKLAEINAQDEQPVTFLKVDAAGPFFREMVEPHGPFDLVILNDVLEHIYDTYQLLANIKSVLARNGTVYFRVPNGKCFSHVLREGHKRVFGIALLPPDYWSHYVLTPVHIYYRPWEHYDALIRFFGGSTADFIQSARPLPAADFASLAEQRLKAIEAEHKKTEYKGALARRYLADAITAYRKEVALDMAAPLTPGQLAFKYLTTFWTGFFNFDSRNW
jgi:2-polyprenyl-3-methyl-5-hydroxy-6-metoxy-1,4-benzoquinol methylase